MKRREKIKIMRKVHRYLGIFLGIQFLMWTISGLYFSWTDIDQIHGDHLKNTVQSSVSFERLVSPDSLGIKISSLELREIGGRPFYWVNKNQLFDAGTGMSRKEISESEALKVISKHMRADLVLDRLEKIDEAGPHHEYRNRLLPAYVASFEGQDEVKAYVSVADGRFQTVRHRNWRWFDFLWMTHTMDYQGRDDFNTITLRIFSLMGLITVLSGFLLWWFTSVNVNRIVYKKRTKV